MAGFPKFRRFADGKLVLGYTKEASNGMKSQDKPSGPSQNPDEVSAMSGVLY